MRGFQKCFFLKSFVLCLKQEHTTHSTPSVHWKKLCTGWRRGGQQAAGTLACAQSHQTEEVPISFFFFIRLLHWKIWPWRGTEPLSKKSKEPRKRPLGHPRLGPARAPERLLSAYRVFRIRSWGLARVSWLRERSGNARMVWLETRPCWLDSLCAAAAAQLLHSFYYTQFDSGRAF